MEGFPHPDSVSGMVVITIIIIIISSSSSRSFLLVVVIVVVVVGIFRCLKSHLENIRTPSHAGVLRVFSEPGSSEP